MGRALAQVATTALATALALGVLLATAVPAAACSCVEAQPMAAYADDPDQVVFTGVVGVPDGRGVPVRVTRWFQGPRADAFVWLDRNGFGMDGASCGTALPPAGTEWIFVAYRGAGTELGVNLCTPHAPASEAAGQAMFADAVATFGQGLVIDLAPETSPATPVSADDQGFILAAAVVAGLAIATLVAVLAALTWRRRGDGSTATTPRGGGPPASG